MHILTSQLHIITPQNPTHTNTNGRIPFNGIETIKKGTELETQVHRMSNNNGLLRHFHSHTDKRYKNSLLKTMLNRVNALSSTTEAFNVERPKLRSIFRYLDYSWSLIDSVISNFESRNPSVSIAERNTDERNMVRISLLFQDQVSVNAVRRQLRDLSHKTGPALQPVFICKNKNLNIRSQAVNRQSAVRCLSFCM